MMLQFARAMAETREACKNITFSLHYLLVPANAVPTSFCFLYRVIRSQVFFK